MARQLEHFDNLVALFLTRAGEKGDKPFLWAKRDGEWRSTSWAEAARQVAALAAGLKRIGLQPGDRVALVSENRPEWLIADLGIMAAGCVTVPTYTTNTISSDFGWGDEVFLSFLPASHAYEHSGGQHFPIALGAEIYYAESLEKLAANIEEVHPTIMVVVPRLFEMLRTRIMKSIESSAGVSKYLLNRAL